VAEGGGLLNRYTVTSRVGGSNPPPSARTLGKLRLSGRIAVMTHKLTAKYIVRTRRLCYTLVMRAATARRAEQLDNPQHVARTRRAKGAWGGNAAWRAIDTEPRWSHQELRRYIAERKPALGARHGLKRNGPAEASLLFRPEVVLLSRARRPPTLQNPATSCTVSVGCEIAGMSPITTGRVKATITDL
jgi:hypothetical protein